MDRYLFQFKDAVYGRPKVRTIIGGNFKSAAYIALLLWFAHIDVIRVIIESENVSCLDFINLILGKHGNFLSFVTNWGLLLMLYLDLLIGKRSTKAVSFLNIFGVLAIICLYGFSAGLNIDASVATKLGVMAKPVYAVLSLIIFIAILHYLKYVSLKPQEIR